MPSIEPPWIATARSLIGKVEDGPTVVDLAHELAAIFPEYAPYLRLVHDDTPWCGEFIAYCLAKNGIRPQFVADSSDTNDFLWAQSWKKFGTAVDDPQVGDILVFARHVTFYVGEDATHYLCLGGNQSDAVNITRFRKDGCEAIRRVVVQEQSAPIAPRAAPKSPSGNFLKVLPALLESEGGYTDDTAKGDTGGPTNYGITIHDFRAYIDPNGTDADVRGMTQAQAERIYWEKYWLPLWCDKLPDGVDYAVFDFGVNSGISRSAKFLQRIVGTEQDGEVGPDTLAATEAMSAAEVINRLCDDRMAFLQGLTIWDTFGRGWTSRVKRVRRDSLALAENQIAAPPVIPAPIKPEPIPMPPVAQPEPPPIVPAPQQPDIGKAMAGAFATMLQDPTFRAALLKGVGAVATSGAGKALTGTLLAAFPAAGAIVAILTTILNVAGVVGGDAGSLGSTFATPTAATLMTGGIGAAVTGAFGLFGRIANTLGEIKANLKPPQ